MSINSKIKEATIRKPGMQEQDNLISMDYTNSIIKLVFNYGI
jgi:hypothetical protein